MMLNIPVYKWVIDENDEFQGVSIMSIVDDPAVEKSFMKYSKTKNINYHVDKDKQIVTGVAIRSGFPVYRNEDGFEFYTVFDADVIEKIVHKFMRELRNKEVNINHEQKTNGAYLFESFILKSGHKGVYPEFSDIEPGSWIVSYKIEDPELWRKIKSGDLNGFSVEMLGTIEQMTGKMSSTKYKIQLYNYINGIIQGDN